MIETHHLSKFYSRGVYALRELSITIDTVKKHVTHIFEKLGAGNRTEAIVRARELALIS